MSGPACGNTGRHRAGQAHRPAIGQGSGGPVWVWLSPVGPAVAGPDEGRGPEICLQALSGNLTATRGWLAWPPGSGTAHDAVSTQIAVIGAVVTVGARRASLLPHPSWRVRSRTGTRAWLSSCQGARHPMPESQRHVAALKYV